MLVFGAFTLPARQIRWSTIVPIEPVYAAKERGRNMTVVAPSLVVPSLVPVAAWFRHDRPDNGEGQLFVYDTLGGAGSERQHRSRRAPPFAHVAPDGTSVLLAPSNAASAFTLASWSP